MVDSSPERLNIRVDLREGTSNVVATAIKFFVAPVKRLKRAYIRARRRHLIDFLVKSGMKLGENSQLDHGVSFGSRPYLVKIGNHVDVSTGVSFITHDGADTWLSDEQSDEEASKYRDYIDVKDNSFIGIGAIVLPGVSIGPRSIVGAGAVVTQDVPPNTVVIGNPAREVCSVDVYLSMKKHRSVPYISIENQSMELARSGDTSAIEQIRQKRQKSRSGG